MPERADILAKLDSELAELIARYRAMSAADLTRPCTDSEVEGAAPWSAKDHLAHLAMIERAFQGMVRRATAGESNPVGFGSRNREEVIASVHRGNQDNVEAHRDDDLETLIADLEAARRDTLSLLAELSDEDLAAPLPGAPWADGSIGGVLVTNAYHQIQHLSWVADGLSSRPSPG